jgi:hypothetical protein
MMGLEDSPYPVIRLYNLNGKFEVQLFAADNGSAIILGTPQRSLAFLQAGEIAEGSSLVLMDKANAQMSFLTTDNLSIAKGRVFLTASHQLPFPGLNFKNKQGDTVYTEP